MSDTKAVAKKSKKPVMPKGGTKLSKEFEFKLTDAQYQEMGKEMAKLDHGIGELETQFEEVKSNWKAKIQAQEAKRKDISAVIHAGSQKRLVEAIMVKNYNSGEVEFWYEGAILEHRVMTEGERQLEVDFNKTAKRARAVKQQIQKADPTSPQANGMTPQQVDIAATIKEETSRKSKLSAVDGPVQ